MGTLLWERQDLCLHSHVPVVEAGHSKQGWWLCEKRLAYCQGQACPIIKSDDVKIKCKDAQELADNHEVHILQLCHYYI